VRSLGDSSHSGALFLLLFELPLGEFLLDDLLVIQFVLILVAKVNLVSLLGFLDDVEVDLDPASLHLLAVHLQERSLGVRVAVEAHVRETLRLLSHPVVRKAEGLDRAETTETVAHVVLFEGVGQVLHEERRAILRHRLCYGLYTKLRFISYVTILLVESLEN